MPSTLFFAIVPITNHGTRAKVKSRERSANKSWQA